MSLYIGIKAYLAGMLISQVIMTFMEGFYLKKYITIDNMHWIILPCLFLILAGMVSGRLYNLVLSYIPGIAQIPALLLICAIISILYILFLFVSKCITKAELAK